MKTIQSKKNYFKIIFKVPNVQNYFIGKEQNSNTILYVIKNYLYQLNVDDSGEDNLLKEMYTQFFELRQFEESSIRDYITCCNIIADCQPIHDSNIAIWLDLAVEKVIDLCIDNNIYLPEDYEYIPLIKYSMIDKLKKVFHSELNTNDEKEK